jgi:hypothetical protein
MQPQSEETIRNNWTKMEKDIYPAIEEGVRERQTMIAAKWNASHNIIIPFEPGQYVMAKDVVIGSKWNEKWAGPYEVTKRGQNGTYSLRNALGEIADYRYPPNHLIPVYEYEIPDEISLEIKRILDVKGDKPNLLYLVQWKDKTLPATWEPSSSFDSLAPIRKFTKSLNNPGTTPANLTSPTSGSTQRPTPGSITSPTSGSTQRPTSGSITSPTSGSTQSPTSGSITSPTSGSTQSPTSGSKPPLTLETQPDSLSNNAENDNKRSSKATWPMTTTNGKPKRLRITFKEQDAPTVSPSQVSPRSTLGGG